MDDDLSLYMIDTRDHVGVVRRLVDELKRHSGLRSFQMSVEDDPAEIAESLRILVPDIETLDCCIDPIKYDFSALDEIGTGPRSDEWTFAPEEEGCAVVVHVAGEPRQHGIVKDGKFVSLPTPAS